MQKLLSLVKEHASSQLERASWLQNIGRHMSDIFSFGLGTEFFITPDSSVLLEAYNVNKGTRSKATFQHKVQSNQCLK